MRVHSSLADWCELGWRCTQAQLDARIAKRRVAGASRGVNRAAIDRQQADRLIAYARVHAELRHRYSGKALSREIRKALPSLYLGRDGLWRKDQSAFNSRPITQTDDQ